MPQAAVPHTYRSPKTNNLVNKLGNCALLIGAHGWNYGLCGSLVAIGMM